MRNTNTQHSQYLTKHPLIGLIMLAGLVVWLAACQPASEVPSIDPEDIAANNRGVALMGQYENEQARQVFAELLEQHPDWVDVEVNLAIATLNRQQPDDELRALEIVENILQEHPDHLRARYIAGLMRFYIGQSDAAMEHFSVLIEAVPDDAHVAYFTAQALGQLGENEQALVLYERAIELDPYLRSAYYGAALTLRQLGQAEKAREQLAIYQRFANNPRAHLAEFRYTRKGRLAEALAIGRGVPVQAPADPEGPLFASPQTLGALPISHVSSLTSVDLDGSGQQDVVVTGGLGQGNSVWMQSDGSWSDVAHPISTIEDVMAVAWADVDNQGALNAYLCRDGLNQLIELESADGRPLIETHSANDVLADSLGCRDVSFLDADHDGDLDVFLTNGDGPNELFSNNLNGTFRRLSTEDEAIIEFGDEASHRHVMADLDGDRDLDLLVVNTETPHRVFINDRLWRYQSDARFDDLINTPMISLVAGDLDANGQMDLVSMSEEGQLTHWQPDSDGQWRGVDWGRVADFTSSQGAETGLGLMDFDGDGALDLLAHHRAGFVVYRILPDGGGIEPLFEAQAPILALAPVLVDPAQGPSVMAAVAKEGQSPELVLWPAGQGRHQFVALDPTGMNSKADGMRSNASGIGTQVVARVGELWSIVDRLDDHGGPGQSLQPMVLGVGDGEFVDFIKLYWSDGVLQTEMALAPGEVHRIEEFQRQLASCPVLFAWNGERFDFVSDILGVGGIGFFQSPDVYAEPRPWEYFRFPEGTALPKEGRYPIKITEPMQEIAYIDTTRLHLYDLPKGWSVALDERMFTGGGPMPDGSPIFYQPASKQFPIRAINDRGEDVVDALMSTDGVAADVGERDPRFLGRLNAPHVLELDFGEVINPVNSTPVLWASGWVEYPYSQTVFAAWQADASYDPPSLSAYHDGTWSPVYASFGYPAGMPREMTLPLNELPANTTKLRIEGNWEVYWDSIAIIEAEPMPAGTEVHVLSPIEARLAKTGFARRDTLAQRRPYYDYNDRAAFWDTQYQSGYYTSLGPVMELVSEANNAFAIVGPGEELHLEFPSPRQTTSGQRVVVLETRGYAKDKDLYTKDGATVGPMPFTPGVGDLATREALHERYMTRYQGGF